jgi:hypothetical protein
LPLFYWGFFHQCSLMRLAYISPFRMCPCSILGWMYYWLRRVRQCSFPFYFMVKFKECWLLVLLWKSCRIQQRIWHVLDFSFLGDFVAAALSLHVIDLFRWLISSRFKFGWS